MIVWNEDLFQLRQFPNSLKFYVIAPVECVGLFISTSRHIIEICFELQDNDFAATGEAGSHAGEVPFFPGKFHEGIPIDRTTLELSTRTQIIFERILTVAHVIM